MIPAYIRIHDALKKKIDDGFLGDWSAFAE